MFPGSNRYTFVFVEKTPSWLFQDPCSRNYVERSLLMCSDEWLLQEAKCTEVTTCFDSCSSVWYMNSSLPWGHSSSCLTNDVGSIIWQPTVLCKTTFYFQGDRLLFKVALSNSSPGFRILFLIFYLFFFFLRIFSRVFLSDHFRGMFLFSTLLSYLRLTYESFGHKKVLTLDVTKNLAKIQF